MENYCVSLTINVCLFIRCATHLKKTPREPWKYSHRKTGERNSWNTGNIYKNPARNSKRNPWKSPGNDSSITFCESLLRIFYRSLGRNFFRNSMRVSIQEQPMKNTNPEEFFEIYLLFEISYVIYLCAILLILCRNRRTKVNTRIKPKFKNVTIQLKNFLIFCWLSQSRDS